jgi:putative oxidoreductase
MSDVHPANRGPTEERTMIDEPDAVILVGRVLLMILFIITGWQKLRDFDGTVAYMRTTAAPWPRMSALVAIVVEFFFGIGIVLGLWTRVLALVFAAFTLGTALLGHRYWRLNGAERHANLLNFYKNVSITGGLLLLVVTGGGRYAITGT